MPRLIICDDDPMMLELLEEFCKELGMVDVVGVAGNGIEVLKLAKKKRPDILLLDIDLPDINGIEVARILTGIDDFLKIIFISCHDDYYAEAFRLYAYDYISKASITERLPKTFKKIIDDYFRVNYLQNECKISISAKGKDFLLDVDELIYLQSLERKLKIVSEIHSLIIYGTLQEWANCLPVNFFQCHRSYIINLQKIAVFNRKEHNMLVMSNGDKIPVSRRRSSRLKGEINNIVLNA
ncbi:response regulator [Iocasia frigidifontis]|uniref:Stage 0 sporulation protein A homolog n=1 Tax=Iocasia fonsfrigidae TaxID=2682810 RepID=A0A8A7K6L1_9FIRM|nr:LytTR family DNA-binding domain-containing protein [Iocasia fonsfrigidae]QTL97011.1 response regulator [Iocasia fonsfrigidae]